MMKIVALTIINDFLIMIIIFVILYDRFLVHLITSFSSLQL